MMKLDDLNDDCLMLIFSLLDLKDQLSVSQTCWRFHSLLFPFWRRTYREFSVFLWKNSCEDLAFFMKNISNTVQKLELGDLSTEEWDIIKQYSYPNLRHLILWDRDMLPDYRLLKMTEMFPNVQWLQLEIPAFVGKHIEKWRHLEYLNFRTCNYVNFTYFEKILKKLSLKSVTLGRFNYDKTWKSKLALKKFCNLEEISLHSNELTLLSDFSAFTNLKKLELLDIENKDLVLKVTRYVAEHKQHDLIELHVTSHFPLKVLFGRTYKNLKKLNLDMQLSKNIVEFSKCAPNSKVIVISRCKERLKDEDICRWLTSTQMELLSVENCSYEFPDLRLIVDTIAKYRTIPMHFNIYPNDNRFKQYEFIMPGKYPLLKLTNNRTDKDNKHSNQFRFQ